MAKRNKGKSKYKEEKKKETSALSLGKYTENFECLKKGEKRTLILELIHYVKVTKSDRYSNNGQIICSPKSPVQLPFQN